MPSFWNGTPEEYADLLLAIERNCACDPTGTRAQVSCGPHRLLRDAAAVNRLLFARRIMGRLVRAENARGVRARSPMLAQDGEMSHG
jgi:hypothetical protein